MPEECSRCRTAPYLQRPSQSATSKAGIHVGPHTDRAGGAEDRRDKESRTPPKPSLLQRVTQPSSTATYT